MIKRRWFGVTVLLAVAFTLGGAGPAKASGLVYVVGSGNEFGTINLTTGAFTQIGVLNLPGGDNIFGMGFGANGNLYALDSGANAELYQINTTNAQVTAIGAIGQSAIGAASDASGKMYALTNDPINSSFYTLQPPSTTTNNVGSTGIASQGLAAVTADGSQFFTTGVGLNNNANYDLYSVNLSTGVATDIGDTGFYEIAGLFVGSTLYGFDDVTNAIVTINTTTGAATQVATYSLPNGDAIFAAAEYVTPEPASLTLLSTGFLGLLGYGWRKRKQAKA
jgi:hypothetical protein